MSRSRPTLFLATGGVLLLLVLFLLTHRRPSPPPEPVALNMSSGSASPHTLDSRALRTASDLLPPTDIDDPSQADSVAALSQKLATHLTRPNTRAHEAILVFKNADGYRRFLGHAAESGVIVVAQIDPLNIVRVRIRAYDTFAARLVARAADFGGVSANAFIEFPPPPAARATGPAFGVGDALLPSVGLPAHTDTSDWGRGVTIAILDGGALPHPTLGARLRYLDIGLGYAGTGTSGQHGTAVAALAAGASADTPGLAPAASLISIRVSDTDSKSDVFTVTQAIVAAVDAGAQVINLSLGGYSTSSALDRAIAYATARGVVLVAAAGNDGASRPTWPAADPRVVSVGATDATGLLAPFSNSGPHLHLTAPGVGIQTAAPDNGSTVFSGTSASAPLVTGAIAALMSQTPGLTAARAVEILRNHSADGGAPGADPDYGHGTLDLGWALARNDLNRLDAAVSGHHYNPDTGALEIVLQNRSARPATQLTLTIELNGNTSTRAIPVLSPGQSLAVPVPFNATATGLTLRTRLDHPEGITDAVPANNTRATRLELPSR